MKRILAVLLALFCLLSLVGCSKKETVEKSNNETVAIDKVVESEDFDWEYDETESVRITLNKNSAESSSDSVRISEGVITITKEATYIISGTLDNGMIIVDTTKKAKPRLVLDGTDITSKDSAGLYILEADKVTVTLAEGTQNRIANTSGFENSVDEKIDGAVFSKKDLVFNGKGSLSVESAKGHGICAKDELSIVQGEYRINAKLHAFDVNDCVVINDGTFVLESGKDGIHCENNEDENCGFIYIENGDFDITSSGDGISSGSYLQIANGRYNIKSGGGSENASEKSSDDWGMRPNGNTGNYKLSVTQSSETESTKGFKSKVWMKISAGEFDVNSADDSFHCATEMNIEGGIFNISTGDDAFHSDETMNILGGCINISKCYEGFEALNITISGGELTAFADDDGINAAGGSDSSGFRGPFSGNSSSGSIVISGGTLNISANGDGIDSNGSLSVTGGNIYIDGPTYGDTSTLDYETEGSVSGGVFVGTGAVGMNMCFDSSSSQGVIMIASSGKGGSIITLANSKGETVIEHTAKQDFDCVILSSADIVSGESYTLSIDTTTKEITMTSLIYSEMHSFGGMPGGNPGGPGGNPGGMRPFR